MLNWQLPSLLKFKSHHKNQIAYNVNHILPQKINEMTGFCIVCQRNYCKMLITQTNSTYGRDHNGTKTFMKSDLNIFESYNFTRFISLSSYKHPNKNCKSHNFFVIDSCYSSLVQLQGPPSGFDIK